MISVLLAVALGAAGAVPSPAAVVLASTSSQRFTRRLIAQAEDRGPSVDPLPPDERAAEQAQLAADMDREAGDDVGVQPAAAADTSPAPGGAMEALEADIQKARRRLGSAEDEPPGAAFVGDEGHGDRGVIDDDEPPRLRRRRLDSRLRALYGVPPELAGPTEEGHGKAYYLAWGIVDWTLAAGAWSGSLYNTVLALSFWGLGTKSRQLTFRERYPSWVDPRSSGMHKSDYRAGAMVTTVLAVLLAAGGGLLAWRAGPNLRTYGQLREEQRIDLRAYRERIFGRRRGPLRRGRRLERAPPEGIRDRYMEGQHADPLERPAGALEKPRTKYRPGDPVWKAYLEQVHRRAQQRQQELDEDPPHYRNDGGDDAERPQGE